MHVFVNSVINCCLNGLSSFSIWDHQLILLWMTCSRLDLQSANRVYVKNFSYIHVLFVQQAYDDSLPQQVYFFNLMTGWKGIANKTINCSTNITSGYMLVDFFKWFFLISKIWAALFTCRSSLFYSQNFTQQNFINNTIILFNINAIIVNNSVQH